MAKKGFMKLKGNELKSLEGLVAAIELQEGCPHRCLGCGTDAKKPGGSMDYEDVMAISKSIEKVRKENGIELILQNNDNDFLFFDGSDPVYYRSHYRGIEKTIWDVGKEFLLRHGKHTAFPTAGWKPGNNYMERAMAQIAKNNREGENKVAPYIGYSIKPFGILIRKEYERFCNRLIGSVLDMKVDIIMDRYGGHADQIVWFKGNLSGDRKDYVNELNMTEWRWLIRQHLTDFFKESKYVHQVIENMKTLQGANVEYCCQYLESMIDYPESLPEQNRKYEFLFSDEFMDLLADYCSQKASGTVKIGLERSWGGVGNALTDFGLEPDSTNDKEAIEACIKHGEDFSDYLFARVLFDGTLNIMYGGYNILGSVYAEQDHLLRLAGYLKKKGHVGSSRFRTLANLQGRNILR